MSMKSKYLWMNGELVEYEKATFHFLTPALHYGVGVFEGIRCYATERGPAVFRLREHIERLVNSAKVFGFRELALYGRGADRRPSSRPSRSTASRNATSARWST